VEGHNFDSLVAALTAREQVHAVARGEVQRSIINEQLQDDIILVDSQTESESSEFSNDPRLGQGLDCASQKNGFSSNMDFTIQSLPDLTRATLNSGLKKDNGDNAGFSGSLILQDVGPHSAPPDCNFILSRKKVVWDTENLCFVYKYGGGFVSEADVLAFEARIGMRVSLQRAISIDGDYTWGQVPQVQSASKDVSSTTSVSIEDKLTPNGEITSVPTTLEDKHANISLVDICDQLKQLKEENRALKENQTQHEEQLRRLEQKCRGYNHSIANVRHRGLSLEHTIRSYSRDDTHILDNQNVVWEKMGYIQRRFELLDGRFDLIKEQWDALKLPMETFDQRCQLLERHQANLMTSHDDYKRKWQQNFISMQNSYSQQVSKLEKQHDSLQSLLEAEKKQRKAADDEIQSTLKDSTNQIQQIQEPVVRSESRDVAVQADMNSQDHVPGDRGAEQTGKRGMLDKGPCQCETNMKEIRDLVIREIHERSLNWAQMEAAAVLRRHLTKLEIDLIAEYQHDIVHCNRLTKEALSTLLNQHKENREVIDESPTIGY